MRLNTWRLLRGGQPGCSTGYSMMVLRMEQITSGWTHTECPNVTKGSAALPQAVVVCIIWKHQGDMCCLERSNDIEAAGMIVNSLHPYTDLNA